MPAAQFERSPCIVRPRPADSLAGPDSDGAIPWDPAGDVRARGATGISGGGPGRRSRHRGWPGVEAFRWPPRTIALLTVVLGLLGTAVIFRSCLPENPRVLVFGDSLMVESQASMRAAARDAGVRALDLRVWSGTAPCDWLADVPTEIRDFRPSIALIGFSGNPAPCLAGRDLDAGYRQDVTTMVDKLVSAGVQVRLIQEPARRNDQVDALGRTALGRIWADIASSTPNTRVVRADLAVTDRGRFVWTLPCDPGEPCPADGRIVVRAPDGVHFCPHPNVVAGTCEVYSSGARRYGQAVARGALD